MNIPIVVLIVETCLLWGAGACIGILRAQVHNLKYQMRCEEERREYEDILSRK
jgi:hypothetical protein